MENIPVIHIGLAKAASSLLQKHLFYKHNEIRNLAIYPEGNLGSGESIKEPDCIYLRDPDLKKFYDRLCMTYSINYNEEKEIELYHSLIKRYNDNKPIIFSNERITSVFYAYPDIIIKANRLKNIFGEAKIILILRRQIDIIISQYRDHPFDPRNFSIGKPVNINQFVTILNESNDLIYLESLKYSKIIDHYSKLFGKENVGVFLFENLKKNPKEFISNIATFIGISQSTAINTMPKSKENRGVSKKFNQFRKFQRRNQWINKIAKQIPQKLKQIFLSWIKKGDKQKIEYDDQTRNFILEYYRRDNYYISKEYHLDLNEYNYY